MNKNIARLKALSIEEVRKLYRAHLTAQGLSPSTIQVSYSDAFYLLRNDDSLDFWAMLKHPDCDAIAYERLKATLGKRLRGNVEANISGYRAHLRRFRRFVLGDTMEFQIEKTHHRDMRPVRGLKARRPDVPQPSTAEVEKYLRTWDELENYSLQEDALNRLFFNLCPENTDISGILLKAAVLNDFYSTNIYSIFPVAKHILDLNIDARLRDGDESLVEAIQNVTIGGKRLKLYSFATKYCSHHNPEDYPIYDSYVDKVLCYFRNVRCGRSHRCSAHG
ncbi:hypothetical protein [Oscillibacter sp.]|uniref:hypothetical protein n=1 Tax=Oscillibacter sp. TaxID=1945593 RepID=UPI00289BE5D6|nr:hypothetical protein [Oscillibacter sp.]